MCLFMKHNPMGINKSLCSLEKLTQQKVSSRETLEILWSFSKLLSIEPNILVVSWRQICNNPFAIKVWGERGQILFKENNIMPPSYLFSICLFCSSCSSIITLCNILNNLRQYFLQWKEQVMFQH